MDCHLRWFRREIMLGVARRVIIEVVVVVAAAAALVTVGGGTTFEATAIALALVSVYPIVRVASSLLLNPTSSSYVNQWERPSGALMIDAPTSRGNTTDVALTAAGFASVGSFSEWGGATTDIYAYAQDNTIAMVSSVDDVILLTTLTDGRACVTTRHLIPPHSSLVVNHQPGSDVADLIAHHATLLTDLLETERLDHVALDINSVPKLLLTEWTAWQELGPLVGPFVDVEHRRLPSILRVRVDRGRILARARTTRPARLAMPAVERPLRSEAVVAPAPEPAPEPTLAPTPMPLPEPATDAELPVEPVPVDPAPEPPVSRLSVLEAQAKLAAEQTDRALAAGGHA